MTFYWQKIFAMKTIIFLLVEASSNIGLNCSLFCIKLIKHSPVSNLVALCNWGACSLLLDPTLTIHKVKKNELKTLWAAWILKRHTRTYLAMHKHVHSFARLVTIAHVDLPCWCFWLFIQQINLENLVCVHSAAYCFGTFVHLSVCWNADL